MTNFELHNQKGNEAEHGCTTIELFSVSMEPKTGKFPLWDQGRLNHEQQR
jgi:hypothetical protein